MNNGPIMTPRGTRPHLPSHDEMLRRLSRRPPEPNVEAPRPNTVPPSARPREAAAPRPRPTEEREIMAQSIAIYDKTVEERDFYKRVSRDQETELRLLRSRLETLEADKRETERERDLSRDQATGMIENVGSAALILSRAVEAYQRPNPPKGNMRFQDLMERAERDQGAARTVDRYVAGQEGSASPSEPPPAESTPIPERVEGSMDTIAADMAELLSEQPDVAETPHASADRQVRFER